MSIKNTYATYIWSDFTHLRSFQNATKGLIHVSKHTNWVCKIRNLWQRSSNFSKSTKKVHNHSVYISEQALTFPCFKASRDIKDFSYPACWAATTSASFSARIAFSFASNASAISCNILLLSCEESAWRWTKNIQSHPLQLTKCYSQMPL